MQSMLHWELEQAFVASSSSKPLLSQSLLQMPAGVVLRLQASVYRGSRCVTHMVSDSERLKDGSIIQGIHLILAIMNMSYHHHLKRQLTLRLRDTSSLGTSFPRSELAGSSRICL